MQNWKVKHQEIGISYHFMGRILEKKGFVYTGNSWDILLEIYPTTLGISWRYRDIMQYIYIDVTTNMVTSGNLTLRKLENYHVSGFYDRTKWSLNGPFWKKPCNKLQDLQEAIVHFQPHLGWLVEMTNILYFLAGLKTIKKGFPMNMLSKNKKKTPWEKPPRSLWNHHVARIWCRAWCLRVPARCPSVPCLFVIRAPCVRATCPRPCFLEAIWRTWRTWRTWNSEFDHRGNFHVKMDRSSFVDILCNFFVGNTS